MYTPPLCPTCRRKLESITDYPFVEILNVERSKLPDKGWFDENNRCLIGFVDSYISRLEGWIGKTIDTSSLCPDATDFKKSLDFQGGYAFFIESDPSSPFYIYFGESSETPRKTYEVAINVWKGKLGDECMVLGGVANVEYKGKLVGEENGKR